MATTPGYTTYENNKAVTARLSAYNKYDSTDVGRILHAAIEAGIVMVADKERVANAMYVTAFGDEYERASPYGGGNSVFKEAWEGNAKRLISNILPKPFLTREQILENFRAAYPFHDIPEDAVINDNRSGSGPRYLLAYNEMKLINLELND